MRSSMVALAAVAALGTASGAGLSSVSSYVQQGLVTHFDAIDNEGTGAHNASTTVWRDLKNNAASLTLRERASWGDTFLNCGTNYQTIVGATSVNSFCATVESAVNLDCIGRGSATKTVWPFLVSSGALSFHGAGDSSRTFRFFVNGADPRLPASPRAAICWRAGR